MLFCHATPRNDEEIFTVRTPDDRIRPMFAPGREPIVVCGHTHMQFHRRLDAIQIVNSGSVGMPLGSTGAHWLRVGPEITFERTDYDLQDTAARIAQLSYPHAADFAARYVLHPPSEADMLAAFEPAGDDD